MSDSASYVPGLQTIEEPGIELRGLNVNIVVDVAACSTAQLEKVFAGLAKLIAESRRVS